MNENETIRENRRAKFLQKLGKINLIKLEAKNIKQNYYSKEEEAEQNNLKQINSQENKEPVKVMQTEELIAQPVSQSSKLKGKSTDSFEASKNLFNYKEIYNKQKYYDNLKEYITHLRLLVFILLGALHFFKFKIIFLDYNIVSHLISTFIIVESTLIFFNKRIDKQKHVNLLNF